MNVKGKVIDPLEFPSWVLTRYEAAGIEFGVAAIKGKGLQAVLNQITKAANGDQLALSKMLGKHRLGSGTAVIACHDRAFLEGVCSDLINLEDGRIISQRPIDHS